MFVCLLLCVLECLGASVLVCVCVFAFVFLCVLVFFASAMLSFNHAYLLSCFTCCCPPLRGGAGGRCACLESNLHRLNLELINTLLKGRPC